MLQMMYAGLTSYDNRIEYSPEAKFEEKYSTDPCYHLRVN